MTSPTPSSQVENGIRPEALQGSVDRTSSTPASADDSAHEFQPFEKMARLTRGCVITEKLDGTNAQIFIADDGETMLVGSRNRWITVDDDNYGFARWAAENRADLLRLGPGRHFGEWWGSGIQRRYGLTGGDKRFSLFNTGRWSDELGQRPACCHVVPVLYSGIFTDTAGENALINLTINGSKAAPGFMDPEGVVVFHSASRTLFKKTIKNDSEPKSTLPHPLPPNPASNKPHADAVLMALDGKL